MGLQKDLGLEQNGHLRIGWIPIRHIFLRPAVLMASLTVNILSLALPIVILQVYDRVIPNLALNTFSLLLIGLLMAMVLEGVIRIARFSVCGWYGAQFEYGLNVAVLRSLLDAPLRTTRTNRTGHYLKQFSSIDSLRNFYAGQVCNVVVDLPFIALFLGLMYAIGGWIIVVPLCITLAFVTMAWGIGRRLHSALKKRIAIDDRIYSFQTETLNGWQAVKGLAMENLMIRRHERLMSQSACEDFFINQWSEAARVTGTLYAISTTIGVVTLGSIQVMTANLSVGGLAACMLLSNRITQPFMSLLTLWNRFQFVVLAQTSLEKTLSATQRNRTPNRPRPHLDHIESVAMHDVYFQYTSDGPDILRNVNLRIKRGEIVCIQGKNSSGKSTLISLMLGMETPVNGQVTYNGLPLEAYEPKSFKKKIAWVEQSPLMFEGTILDNLSLFGANTDLEEIYSLTAEIGLHDFVSKLPNGYHTQIWDDSASGLPIGVVQMIGLVRALAQKTEFILLDDALATLDPDNRKRLGILLKRRSSNAAVLIVSHALLPVDFADRELTLHGGTLKDVTPVLSGEVEISA